MGADIVVNDCLYLAESCVMDVIRCFGRRRASSRRIIWVLCMASLRRCVFATYLPFKQTDPQAANKVSINHNSDYSFLLFTPHHFTFHDPASCG